MIELGYAIGGEELGIQPCDGLICATPVGLDRVQPLERRAGARLGPRGDGRSPSSRRTRCTPGRSSSGPTTDLVVTNRSADVAATVLVDGHPGRRARAGRARRDAPRPRAEPARDAARAELLPALRRRFRRRLEDGHSNQSGAGRTMRSGASPSPHREPRPHPRGGARARRRAERDHRRDRRRQDDPLERDRAPARLEGRCGGDRCGGGRGVRRGRVRPAGRRCCSATLAELRPEGEDALVVARRIFADGRTRAYAWGRSAAREDVAAVVEGLLAMSGQFEQRRLARPSYQLAVLDAFAGSGERSAGSPAGLAGARPRHGASTPS